MNEAQYSFIQQQLTWTNSEKYILFDANFNIYYYVIKILSYLLILFNFYIFF